VSENRSAGGRPAPAPFSWLEWITAGVLLAVIAALGWMVLAAYFPDWAGKEYTEAQVVVVSGLLLAALLLVSAVALLHTRR
jgi:hypothetical protein